MKKTPVIISVVVALLLIIGFAAFAYQANHRQPTTTPITPITNQPSTQSMPNMSQGQSGQNQTPEQTSGNTVTIQNFAYNPASLTVKKGTTVKWTNSDTVAHTVTEDDNKAGPNSTALENGQTYSFTFNETGTFSYKCTIHPTMHGTVTVTD